MAPKRALAQHRAPAAADAEAMNAMLQSIIERNIPVQRYKKDAGQFARTPDGRQVRLMRADNQPTAAGKAYYELLGVPVPTLYDYTQPLLQDKWVRARDDPGAKILVRRRGADGNWVITKRGEGYFRFNRSEYMPRAAFFVAKRAEDDPDEVVPADDGLSFDLRVQISA